MNARQEKLLNSIEMMITEKVKQLKLDYTITAKVLSQSGDIYTVGYQGGELSVKAREGLDLLLDDIVYIRVVQGNFSEKFIDCKKP